MSPDIDTEFLIARLSGPLAPSDRPLFLHDAEVALAALTVAGDGSIYRAVAPLWRRYFVPPPDGLHGPNQYRRSKLISAPAIGRGDRSDEL